MVRVVLKREELTPRSLLSAVMSHRVANFNVIAPFDEEELLEYVEEHKYTGYKPWAERIQQVFESTIDKGNGHEEKIAEKIAVKESYHAVVDHLHCEKANLKPDRERPWTERRTRKAFYEEIKEAADEVSDLELLEITREEHLLLPSTQHKMAKRQKIVKNRDS